MRVIELARKECRSIDISLPLDEANFELVHATGTPENPDVITDKVFGAMVSQSYRLVRTVEMY